MTGPSRRRVALLMLLCAATLLSASMLAPAFGAPKAVSATSLASKVAKALKLSRSANRNAKRALARAGQPGAAGEKGETGEACLPTNPACTGPAGQNGTNGTNGEKGAPGDPAPASAHSYSLQMPAAKSGGITQVLFSTPLATLLAQCKDDAGSIVAKYQVIFLENHPIVVASDPPLLGEQFQTGTASATLLSSPTNPNGTFKPEAHGLTYAVTGAVNADGQSCSFHASTVES